MWLHRPARSNVVKHVDPADRSDDLSVVRNRILICFVKTYTIVQERHAVQACRKEV